jgi:hypothetical protein
VQVSKDKKFDETTEDQLKSFREASDTFKPDFAEDRARAQKRIKEGRERVKRGTTSSRGRQTNND